MTIARARRMRLPITIVYRRVNGHRWHQARVVDVSETGVLFGPTDLEPGAPIEVTFSSPVDVGSFAAGKQVCPAEVVRTTDTGAAAIRFDNCRFLLQA